MKILDYKKNMLVLMFQELLYLHDYDTWSLSFGVVAGENRFIENVLV